MHLILIVLIAVAFLAIGTRSICVAGAGRSPQPASASTAPEKSSSSTDLIRAQLQQLADSTPPKKLSMGAMCYKMAMPPNRAEFHCQTCSNKTIYAASDEERWNQDTRFLNRELDACRRLVKEIRGLRIQLDESLLCKKCTPDAKVRKLALVIEYPDTGKTHRTVDINLNDLRLLKEFTEGRTAHSESNDRETPLKNHIERLEQLLGVTLEEE